MSAAGPPPPRLRLTRLALTRFRSYAALNWLTGAAITVLAGPNGSGKTNLLEGMSLLVPGRGLRGAKSSELRQRGASPDEGWGVFGRFETPEGLLDIGTGIGGGQDRRVFRIDGEAARSQSDVADRVSAVWLTPQMDRLFTEAASGRRRFLDRLVLALEPAHGAEAAALENAMAQRNRLLAQPGADPSWLEGLEDAMARHGVAVAAARRTLADRLTATLHAGMAGAFPAVRLTVLCPVADRLAGQPALTVEDWLRSALAANRARDAAAGFATFGAHRADLALHDAASGQDAASASTGQQKAMLIGVVLGHAALLAEARGAAPLLLLDEPAVHLDAARRIALFQTLRALPAQSFLTGTDLDVFAPLRGAAAAFSVHNSALLPAPGWGAPHAGPAPPPPPAGGG